MVHHHVAQTPENSLHTPASSLFHPYNDPLLLKNNLKGFNYVSDSLPSTVPAEGSFLKTSLCRAAAPPCSLLP